MNTQINEDFVSFEVAKLLKEKGFDWECNQRFDSDGIFRDIQPTWNWNMGTNRYSAPTLQMAMKWLREVHEIYIEIPIYSIGKPVLYRWNAFKNGRLVTDEEKPKTSNVIIKGDDNNPTVYYYKYEEACEVAIKYCLENLI